MLNPSKVKVFLNKAFDKMTKMVDAPRDVIDSSKDWYLEYTWTEKQRQEFKEWFIKEFTGFDLMWGWKIKEEK